MYVKSKEVSCLVVSLNGNNTQRNTKKQKTTTESFLNDRSRRSDNLNALE